MTKVKDFLRGKKTYILGVLGVVWAISGWLMGYIDSEVAMTTAWGAMTAMAIRAGVANK